MVKKRSIPVNSKNSITESLNPVDKKTLEDDLSLLDHSIIREPINLGIKNVHQIITCIKDGTKEVKDLIFNECNIIYECRICRNLFRSLANFLAHKRLYCKKHCCEKMILFDSNWFDFKNEQKEFTHNENISSNSKVIETLNETLETNTFGQTENISKPDSDQNETNNSSICDQTEPDNKNEDDESFLEQPSASNNTLLDSEERITKKKRIESLISKLNMKRCNIPPENIKDETLDHSPPPRQFKTSKFVNEESNGSFEPNNLSMKMNIKFNCKPCNVTCSYVSSATRHLINFHRISRQKAKNMVFDFLEKYNEISETMFFDGFHFEEKPSKLIITDITKMETRIVSCPTKTFNENNSNPPECNRTNFYDLSSPGSSTTSNKDLTNISPEEKQTSETQPTNNNNHGLFTNKRYETRCSVRKKCFYNCNSKSCFFSKHCNTIDDQIANINENNPIENGSNEQKKKTILRNPTKSSTNNTLKSDHKVPMIMVHNHENRVFKKKIKKKLKKSTNNLENHHNNGNTMATIHLTQDLVDTGNSVFPDECNSPEEVEFISDSNIEMDDSNLNSNADDSNDIISTVTNTINSNDDDRYNLSSSSSTNNELSHHQIQFDDAIETMVATSHSPLITKLSLKKTFNESNVHHKSSKESRLKIHLRTTGSKKCYQIVDT